MYITKRTYDVVQYSQLVTKLKSNLRITSDDFDYELRNKLDAAIASAENFIGKVIVMSVIEADFEFSERLPLLKPFISLGSVSLDGDVLTEGTDYTLTRGVLTFGDGVEGETVGVVLEAGWARIPDDVQAAIILHASALFNNPVDSVETLPKASDNLLRPYRSWGLGK